MWNSVDGRINTALNRIRKAFRAVLTRVNSGGQVQTVQARALAGEQLQDNELFQHYGFTSNPLPGTMAVILPLGGNTSHGVIIATEHGAYRLAGLQSGEIVLKRGRIIDVECDTYRVTCKNYEVNAEEKADFNTPMVTASEQVTAQNKITGNGGMAIKGGTGATFEGNINQTSGNYETTGDVKAGSISLLKHHHIDSMSGSTSGAKA